jgi:hypothetical protein
MKGFFGLVSLLAVLLAPSGHAQVNIGAGSCAYGTVPTNLTWVQPGYQFRHRRWLMKGNALTPSDEYLTVEFTPPPEVAGLPWNCVRAFLRGPGGGLEYLWTSGVSPGTTLEKSISLKVSPQARPAGTYHILLAADDQTLTFADLTVFISAPLYVVLSTDWDMPTAEAPGAGGSYAGASIGALLKLMDDYRKVDGINGGTTERPGFAYSHFVGPYIWGNPHRVPTGSQRAPAPPSGTVAERIEQWLKSRGSDEVGVHIHGWTESFLKNIPAPACCATATCSTGTVCPASSAWPPACCGTASCAAGVACMNPPSLVARYATGWDASNTDGYSTELRDYSLDELVAMLDYSSQILVSRGFAQPRSFRAGGWTAGPNLLMAMARTRSWQLEPSTGRVVSSSGPGYLVDSSAVWPDPVCAAVPDRPGYTLCGSVRSTDGLSAGLTQTAQPYRHLASGILEVPDNGVGIDYQNSSQMNSALLANGAGGVLASPRMFQFMFHPHSVTAYTTDMELALRRIDAVSYGFDNGPAVYVRLSDLRLVY